MTRDLEEAKILTLSLLHLHPDTRALLVAKKGDIEEGPSIAMRDEGFLVNTHIGVPEAADLEVRSGLFPALNDRFPDLVMARALARGLGISWINFDEDGPEHPDLLPVYEGAGGPQLPTDEIWSGGSLRRIATASGIDYLQASFETLEIISKRNDPRDAELDFAP